MSVFLNTWKIFETVRAILFAVVLFLLVPGATLAQETVEVVTESWKPFSYQEDGVIRGSATKIVRAVLETAGIEYSMTVYPWARAYKTALRRDSVLIFAMVRTAQRELMFKWVGQVAPTDKSSFYRLKGRNDIAVASIEDAKKYVVGVNIDSDKHQFLVKHGFKKLSLVTKQELSPKQLMAGHIDLWLMHDINMAALIESQQIPADQFEKVFIAFESRPYMAFSKGTPDQVVQKTIRAYVQLLQDGHIPRY